MEYLPMAMDALKTDSQKGTFGKRGNKPKASQHSLDMADKVFVECGLPIKSNMNTEEFRNIILSGTYTMRSEQGYPSIKYENINFLEKFLLDVLGIRALPFVW